MNRNLCIYTSSENRKLITQQSSEYFVPAKINTSIEYRNVCPGDWAPMPVPNKAGVNWGGGFVSSSQVRNPEQISMHKVFRGNWGCLHAGAVVLISSLEFNCWLRFFVQVFLGCHVCLLDFLFMFFICIWCCLGIFILCNK